MISKRRRKAEDQTTPPLEAQAGPDGVPAAPDFAAAPPPNPGDRVDPAALPAPAASTATAVMEPPAPPEAPEPSGRKGAKGAKAAKAAKAPKGAARRGAEASGPAAVNLLSPWVLEELHVLGLRKRFLAAGVVLLLVIGLAWTALTLRLHQSEDEVDSEEAVADALALQIKDLGDVRTFISTVKNRQVTAAAMAAAQAQMSSAMETLAGALPRGAEFESVTLVITGEEADEAESDPESACPAPDPFGANTTIGCVQLSGTADNRADVSRFVQQLAASELFIEPFVDTTTKGTERGVSFTGSVGLTPEARHGDATGQLTEDDETEEEGS